jgi:hypothetical protein
LTLRNLRRPDLRASQPALLAAARVIAERRDAMIADWSQRAGDRLTASPVVPPSCIERQFRLMLSTLGESVGPYRREAIPLWERATELYGRTASLRGLAAGEVVEELQHLREILTLHLAPVLAGLRPRQAMAIMLRLNRVFDRGIATAVVGYTDALVATLFANGGVPSADSAQDLADIERQKVELERELGYITRHP